MELGPIFRALMHNTTRFWLITLEVALSLAIVANCVNLIQQTRHLVLLILALALVVAGGMLTAHQLLGPKREFPEKLDPFECGERQIVSGQADIGQRASETETMQQAEGKRHDPRMPDRKTGLPPPHPHDFRTEKKDGEGD